MKKRGIRINMSFDYNTNIETQILSNLDGWIISDNNSETVSPYTDDLNISELSITKRVTSTEVELFYYKTLNLVTSYLGQNLDNFTTEDEPIIQECICLWAAGLLWRKYNLKITNQDDETNTLGYGDELIIKAKNTIKPYRYRKLVIW